MHVNLEQAMPAAGRYGGHIVAGHADGVGTITRIRRDDTAVWYTVRAEPAILRYIVEKGSVTIDGISLTVAKTDTVSFSVSVIPHTLRVTALGNAAWGQCQSGNGYHCKISGKAGTSSRRIHSESAAAAEYCYGGIFVTSRFLEQFKEAKRMFEFDTVEEALEELKNGKNNIGDG